MNEGHFSFFSLGGSSTLEAQERKEKEQQLQQPPTSTSPSPSDDPLVVGVAESEETEDVEAPSSSSGNKDTKDNIKNNEDKDTKDLNKMKLFRNNSTSSSPLKIHSLASQDEAQRQRSYGLDSNKDEDNEEDDIEDKDDYTTSNNNGYLAPPVPRSDLDIPTNIHQDLDNNHNNDNHTGTTNLDDVNLCEKDDGSIEMGFAHFDTTKDIDKDMDNAKKDKEEPDEYELNRQAKYRHRRLLLLSNLLFVLGSALYMTMAVDDLQWSKEARSIPTQVLVADDDVTWMEYRTTGTISPTTTTEAPLVNEEEQDNNNNTTSTTSTGRNAGQRHYQRNRRHLLLYDDFDWAELPLEIQAAAELLGYDQVSWDNGLPVYTEDLFWAELTLEQQEAATLLGYDQASWDSDTTAMDDDDGIGTAPPTPTTTSDDITPTDDAMPTSPDNTGWFSTATDDTPTTDDATTLETQVPQQAQDEPILPYDDILWDDLPDAILAAAQVLGYNAYRWNNDLPPQLVIEFNPSWDELTEGQQEAASVLGYSADTWWYIRRNYNDFSVPVNENMGGNGENDDTPEGDETTATTATPQVEQARDPNASTGEGGAVAVEWELYDWEELPPDVQNAYRVLGWNGDLWDSGGSVETDTLWWSELTPEQQAAALFLGYTEAQWDSTDGETGTTDDDDDDTTGEESRIVWEDFDWEALPKDIQDAYTVLGYNQTIWDEGGSVESEEKSWDELTLVERAAAISIGYTQSVWDGSDSTTTSASTTTGGDKDGEDMEPTDAPFEQIIPDAEWHDYWWSELPPDVQDAYALLGYSQHSWDNNKPVETDVMDWDELSLEQQEAASFLGFTQEIWDQAEVAALSDTGSEYVSADDDYIFLVPSRQVWVSRYMILYFAAALCFVFVGLVDFIRERAVFHVCMILGGLCGLISAMIIERNRTASMVMNLISVHFFLLEGLNIIKHRIQARRHRQSEMEDDEISAPDTSLLSGLWWIPTLQITADFFFVVGAFMDAVLSYFLFERSSDWDLALARVFGFSVLLWVACSLLYLFVTLVLHYGLFPGCLGQDKHPMDPEYRRGLRNMTYLGPLPTPTNTSHTSPSWGR